MGVKRPLEGDSCTESSFKHPKLSDINKEATLFTGREEAAEIYSTDDRWPHSSASASLVDDELEGNRNVPMSLYAREYIEGNVVKGDSFYPSPSRTFINFSTPWAHIHQLGDPYAILIDRPQYKHVSIGPDYQAELPDCNPTAYVSCCHDATSGVNHKFLGTLVIPGPASPASDEGNFGPEQVVCNCLDMGSIRCYQKHIDESRERLWESIGHAAFRDLGLCDIGEKNVSEM